MLLYQSIREIKRNNEYMRKSQFISVLSIQIIKYYKAFIDNI